MLRCLCAVSVFRVVVVVIVPCAASLRLFFDLKLLLTFSFLSLIWLVDWFVMSVVVPGSGTVQCRLSTLVGTSSHGGFRLVDELEYQGRGGHPRRGHECGVCHRVLAVDRLEQWCVTGMRLALGFGVDVFALFVCLTFLLPRLPSSGIVFLQRLLSPS